MNKNPLGRDLGIVETYKPDLLYPIKRSINRDLHNITVSMNGFDLWNAYEFSYLDLSGKPVVRRLQLVYPASSVNMVESKSLKLYLFSFAMTRFADDKTVLDIIKNDLSRLLETDSLIINVSDSNDVIEYTKLNNFICIDACDAVIESYTPSRKLLAYNECDSTAPYKFISHLLKSNCPITGQPDWATLLLQGKGKHIPTEDSLLKYIVSYRNHQDYHENCCEQILQDMVHVYEPDEMCVKCFYTRRGGIEINPCRFYNITPDNDFSYHFWRQ